MSEAGSAGAEGGRAEVDIIIVNWNAGALLKRCLDAVAQFGGPRVHKTLVIDNGSVDGSADIQVDGIGLDVVKTGENLGFGRACNLGAERATAKYILLLNPDTELRAGAIDTAIGFMEQPENAAIGVCGAKLVDQFGHQHRHCTYLPNWRTFVGHSLGLTHVLPGVFPSMWMTDFDHLSSRPVDHVMGAFYLIRRELFVSLGGFDDRFFVYLEDLDLSLRVAQSGHQVYYLAEAEVYHKQGGTSEQVKAKRLYYSTSAQLAYSLKHFSKPAAWGVAAATLLIEPFTRSLLAIARRSRADLANTWQGFAMLYRAAPAILRSARTTANPGGAAPPIRPAKNA